MPVPFSQNKEARAGVINLPAISARTEEEMMKVGRSEKDKKKKGEDKTIETLTKKLLERFNEITDNLLSMK